MTELDLRASDAERERTVGLLRDHAVEGRLTSEEMAERIEAAFAARTRGELAALTEDLPGAGAPRREPRRTRAIRAGVLSHAASYVAVSVLLVAVWAATGADYFWPIWPMLGWGIGLMSHGLGVGACGRGDWGPGHARGPQRAV
jgi:uncharacterized protein DUF1707/2TM domain-containing protein